jgi:uncharacterized protein (TIGR03000 family)
LALLVLLGRAGAVCAGVLGFGEGIGPSMWYGPYTGGHGYSYNVAYSYGFAFSSADTWWRDPLAYLAGPYPYPLGPYPPRRYLFVHAPPCVVPGEPVVTTVGGQLALQPVPPDGPAIIRVTVPANAEVWVDNNKTAQTGSDRTFQSPPLRPDTKYIYTVRARWTTGGQEFEQIQAIDVGAGQEARVAFPRARP